jgi:hypothetical protein
MFTFFLIEERIFLQMLNFVGPLQVSFLSDSNIRPNPMSALSLDHAFFAQPLELLQ